MESEFELKIDRALKKVSIPGTILIVLVFILLSSFSPAVADFFKLL